MQKTVKWQSSGPPLPVANGNVTHFEPSALELYGGAVAVLRRCCETIQRAACKQPSFGLFLKMQYPVYFVFYEQICKGNFSHTPYRMLELC